MAEPSPVPQSQSAAPKGARKERRHPRHEFRARSHALAHEDSSPAGRIPDHPLVPRNHPHLIDQEAEFRELVEHLRAQGSFTYDSEFIGEMSYYPKLCVIQVSTRDRVALVDGLATFDLRPFWELVADPSIEKVVHAGQQDLEPVFRAVNKPPANIFDTQIAAGFVGLAYPSGLSKLVKELVGVHLGKGLTFTHWDQRPLSNVQLRYAADDVRYLPALREAIGARLKAAGHEAWAKEECEALCDPALYHLDPSMDYMRLRGASGLTPQGAAVLRELYVWREDAAKRSDTPPRSFLKDEILIELSRRPIRALGDLDRVRGLPRPVEENEGPRILEATQRGQAVPAGERPIPVSTEESPAERFSVDALFAVIQAHCAGQDIDPALVCSRRDVAEIVRAQDFDEALRGSKLMRGWRRAAVGNVLMQMRDGSGEVRLKLDHGRVRSDA